MRLQLGDGEYIVSSAQDESLRDAVHARSAALLRSEIHLQAEEHVLSLPLHELGFSIDTTSLEREAQKRVQQVQQENRGFSARRLYQGLLREKLTTSMVLPLQLDLEQARQKLETWSSWVDREALDAEMRIAERRIIRSETGRKLSIEASLVRLQNSSIERDTWIPLAVTVVPPQVTEQDLLPVDITRVLASYESSFRGRAGARETNIRAGARLLDGAVILPGETLSFNGRVGRRVHGRGFVDAPVIINDEMEQDVGGGVCQVATTLFAAAIHGNLKIVQRRSHSRPIGYVPLGLDAVVVDGEVDLKISNPYDEPLLVHARIVEGYTLRIEILGRDSDVQVEHATTITHREPFSRRVWYRPELRADKFERKQKGSEGMDVTSVLKIKKKDGSVERRSYHSKYYPVPEVFWAGKNVQLNNLPKLPEGAVSLVVDGKEVSTAQEEKPPSPEDVPPLGDTPGGPLSG